MHSKRACHSAGAVCRRCSRTRSACVSRTASKRMFTAVIAEALVAGRQPGVAGRPPGTPALHALVGALHKLVWVGYVCPRPRFELGTASKREYLALRLWLWGRVSSHRLGPPRE